jgi:hypothetical protein
MPIDQLTTLQESVSGGNGTAALDQIGPTTDAIDRRRRIEDSIDRLARAVKRMAPSESGARSAATAYFEAATMAENRRLELVQTLSALLDPDSDVSVSTAADAVEQTITAERTLRDRIDALERASRDVSLPMVLSLRGPNRTEVAAGSSVNLELILENLGGRPATDLDIGTDPSESVDVTPTTVEGLAPDSDRTLTLSGRIETAGRQEVTVSATGAESDASAVTTIVALSVGDYLEQALRQTRSLQSTVEEIADRENLSIEESGNESDQGNGSGGGPPTGRPDERRGGNGSPGNASSGPNQPSTEETKNFAPIAGRLRAIEKQIEQQIELVDQDRAASQATTARFRAIFRHVSEIQDRVARIDSIDPMLLALLVNETDTLTRLLQSARDAGRD